MFVFRSRLQSHLDHQRFNDNDRAINDDAKVNRTQGNQVGRDLEQIHHDKHEEQGQRDQAGNDERDFPVA